jgi:hypothetical protein
MRRMRIPALLLVLASAGCYHVTVLTGAPPAPQVVDKQWQSGWVYGLIAPPELNVKDACSRGVSKVETERSAGNAVVALLQGAILFGIQVYTPMHTKVTCASGPVAR